jgi:methyl-accepting chemotaxis protein
MTELPGRKAIFTGAEIPIPPGPSPEEIAEIRNFEKTIAELKNQLDVMVRNNPVPMIQTTPTFTITEANAAYIQMSGISEKDLLKTNLKNFRIINQTGEGAKVAIQSKRRSFGEVTVELPSGTRILEQYCIPIMDSDQQITSLLFVYNEITAQKKRTVEIEQLKQRSETIVQQNPIPMLMTKADFVIIEANTAYGKMSGIPREKVIGTSLRDVKILEQKGEGAKVAIGKKQRAFGEVTVELPSGTHILEQYVMPILDANNDLSHLLFVYNEVTEQRKSQQELQKKMDEVALLKLRSDIIVNQNPMPIMLMNTQFNIIMANDAYLSLTGLARDRLLKMNAKDFKILEQQGEGLKKVIQEKKRSLGEIKIEFPTGVHILNQYGIPMVDPKGNLQTIVCVYNDITKQREQELKIKAMMDEAQAKADLLTASASELQKALATIAAGDLTFEVSIDEADPLVRLKVDYNEAANSIRGVLSDLMQAMHKLDATIHDTIKSTEEIAKATEQVAISSQKAADNSKVQINNVEKISTDISDISASIQEIASSSHEVMTHADKASKEGAQAAEIGKVATTKMQNAEKIAKQSVDDITALNDQMRTISKIVNLITDIANQTNLLALNAAIEAARAGEHGRGFAVVAGEVKNLAGESKKASSQIETLIKTIQAKSDQTTHSMKNSFEEIKAGIDSVNKTVVSLNLIINEANIVTLGVKEITKATEDQAQATNKLLSNIESVSALTQDNQQRMEDMAALAEETSASTEEIASASTELAELAAHSRKMMEKFQLN